MTAGNSESEGQEAARKIKEETLTGKGKILHPFLYSCIVAEASLI